MANESKKIVLKYKDGDTEKEYTLMYNKWSVRRMQENGFDISKIDTMPNVVIPDLFAGAFMAKQPAVDYRVVEKIYEDCENKEELIKTLAEMYAEPVKGLMDEGNTKNVTWTVV